MNRRTKCFISSTAEDLELAHKISDFLTRHSDVDVITWYDSSFLPGMSIFDNLREIMLKADFVIVLISSSQEKKLIRRDKKELAGRDNMLFELGFILGMGKPVLLLSEKGQHWFTPSDIGGILFLEYEPEKIEDIFHYLQKWAVGLAKA